MKKWEILREFRVKSLELRVQDLMKILLRNRGIKTEKETEEFLHPNLDAVTSDSVGINNIGLNKAIKRIEKAMKQKEQIIVYGDYDVDGITGTAILWETLYAIGAQVMPYIPHRVNEGYGLSIAGIENLKLKIKNCKLIITVDNGIVAHEAVDFANANGIDVIITDHHTLPAGGRKKLPGAYAFVHTTKLCGAGVAWILSKAIKKTVILGRSPKAPTPESPQEKEDSGQARLADALAKRARMTDPDTNFLDLVALATVADLVPLTGANRALLKAGVSALQHTKRIGLQALFNEAQIDPKTIGIYEIGHIIGPRLNAMGRLESAMDSLRLLCTKDKKRAENLAHTLGETNRGRQLLTQASSLHAVEGQKSIQQSLKKNQKLLFVTSDYEEGIIGLVAGRLVETFYKPAIVVSKGEKISKASARSVKGFNIIEFIRTSSHLLLNAGGHPMAAGFTVETEKLTLLQKFLEKQAEQMITDDHLTRTLQVDCELPIALVTQELYEAIQILAPFGMGNPEPTFMSKGLVAEDVRAIGKDKKHLKMKVKAYPVIASDPSADGERGNLVGIASSLTAPRNDEYHIEAIAFGMGDRLQELLSEKPIDIVYTIDENEWMGRKNIQLKIKDIKIV